MLDNIKKLSKNYSCALFFFILIFCTYFIDRLSNKVTMQVHKYNTIFDSVEYIIILLSIFVLLITIEVIFWKNFKSDTELSGIPWALGVFCGVLFLYIAGRTSTAFPAWGTMISGILSPFLGTYVLWRVAKYLIDLGIHHEKERLTIVFGVLGTIFAVFQVLG